MKEKVCLVIPAYNEVGSLEGVVKEASRYSDTIIVVDDGSRDKTGDFCIEKNEKDVYFLRHVVNLGKGAAMRTGAIFAQNLKCDFLVFMDADGQHDPQDIKKLVDCVKEKKGLAIGKREKNKNMPLAMKVGNFSLSLLIKTLFKLSVEDTQSGFRAIRLEDLDKILWTSCDYNVETEMLIKAKKNQISIFEVPIKTVYNDKYKGTTFIDGIKIFLQLLKLRFYD
ncbi:glycosyltransferase family 2 protein [Patescibacteria group bacterium]|nr:glycosyltransferase family 2 protein [Patescibacteria group bacterium]